MKSSPTASPAKSKKSASAFKSPAPGRPADSRKEIFFELDASAAKEVLLAGDFTEWEKMPIKLHPGENGGWYATVLLAPGKYHYKFIVDGKWQEDPCASARRQNPFGTANSILEI